MPSAIARSAIAPVLAEPRVRADQVTQLLLGETAAVVDRSGEWRRVCTAYEGYDGWIHSGYLSETEDSAAEAWRARATGWSEGAVLAIAGSRLALPLRARVVLAGDTVELPDGRRGRVTGGGIREMRDVVPMARAKAPERWALEYFVGAPYQWGGITPWGVDCSGLVQTTFAARSVTLPRDAAQQVAHGQPVPLEGVRPGDLLFSAASPATVLPTSPLPAMPIPWCTRRSRAGACWSNHGCRAPAPPCCARDWWR